MKSDTCLGKSGKPLAFFATKFEAQSSADYERGRGRKLYPYQCERCGQWHLAREESRVDFRENACSCTDSRGNGKRLYATREDAEKASGQGIAIFCTPSPPASSTLHKRD